MPTAPALFGAPQAKIDTLLSVLGTPIALMNTSTAPKMVITYRFNGASQPIDQPGLNFPNFTAYTAAEQTAVNSVIAEFEQYLNVDFVVGVNEASTNANPLAKPHVVFTQADMSPGNAGLGGFNSSYGTTNNVLTSRDYNSFVLLEKDLNLSSADGRHVIVHELAHALSLKHPGNYGVGDTPPFLSAAEDNNQYTTLSYNPHPATGLDSDHLMLYDIAALQARWGANMTTRTGNTVYTGPTGRAEVIWDAGGVDTIDASARTTAVTINLTAGKFSSVGGTNNYAIAYGAVIENAKGGSNNDTLFGNTKNNVILGNGGADKIYGKGGNDTLTGGAAVDRFYFDTAPNATTNKDIIADFDPVADFIHLENAVFTAFAALAVNANIGSAAFHSTATAVAAHDTTDRIIYNRTTGNLYYDRDGANANGTAFGAAPIHFATLTGSPDSLAFGDFLIA